MAPPVAVEADLAVEEVPEAVVDLAHLPLAQRAVLPWLAVLALLALLAQREVEAELAVEEPRCRSFSAAMAGNLTSTGTPRYSPVPRSGRKAKRRP